MVEVFFLRRSGVLLAHPSCGGDVDTVWYSSQSLWLTRKVTCCMQGIVRLKNMWNKGEGDEKGESVNREELVAVLKERIAALGSGDALLTKQTPS